MIPSRNIQILTRNHDFISRVENKKIFYGPNGTQNLLHKQRTLRGPILPFFTAQSEFLSPRKIKISP